MVVIGGGDLGQLMPSFWVLGGGSFFSISLTAAFLD
jgi:hypothetical protein